MKAGVKRNLAWMGAGQGAFFVLQFAGTVVLARLLTPREMGVFALATAIVGALSLLQSFGVGSYIIREKAVDREDLSTAFTVNALICLVLSGLIFTLATFAWRLFSEPGVKTVLYALTILPLFSIIELLPIAQIERAGRFRTLVFVGFSKNLTATAVTVTAAFAGHSYMSLAYGQLAGAAVSALVVNILGRGLAQFELSLERWRKLTQFGGHMLAINGANSLATRASDIALGRILGLDALGFYNRATNVYRLFWDNLHLVIGRVLFVDLAERRRRGESLRDSYLLICETMTACMWPAFIGLVVLAKPLFQTIYGEKWVPAATPFTLFALSAVIQVSITMTWEIFTVSRETGRQARIEAVRTILGLGLFIAACFISLTAAAASKVLESAISMCMYRSHLERMTDTRFKDFVPIYLRSAALSALAVAPAALLMLHWRGSADVPLWQMLTSVGFGMLLWSLGLWRMRHPLFHQLSEFVRRRLGSASTQPADG